MTDTAAQTHSTADEADVDNVPAFMLTIVADAVADVLTSDPALREIARDAALRTIACHSPGDEVDLLLTAQMVSLSFASLRTLGTGLRPGMTPAEARRNITLANTLQRSEAHLRQVRDARQKAMANDNAVPAQTPARATVKAAAAQPEPAPARVQPQAAAPAVPAKTAAPPSRPTASAMRPPSAGAIASRERREREAWANAAEEAAQAAMTAAHGLPPELRQMALDNARILGNAARDVRAGLPVPTGVQLAG